MGKDADGACCESCRLFGGEPAPLPETPSVPLRAAHEEVRIVVQVRGEATREIAPTGPEVLVGRAQGNHVVLASGNISRRQCRFVFQDGKVIVEDTGSSCGTYVNGRKVNAAVIDENATIHVGDFTLRLRRVS
jgi:pSer/pThr/pTyr-binding forkhead associated (FHA) protein